MGQETRKRTMREERELCGKRGKWSKGRGPWNAYGSQVEELLGGRRDHQEVGVGRVTRERKWVGTMYL